MDFSGINIIAQVDSFEKLNLQYTVNTAVYNEDGTTTIFCEVVNSDRPIMNTNISDDFNFSGIKAVVFTRENPQPPVSEEPPIIEEPEVPVVEEPPVIEEPVPPVVDEPEQPPIVDEPEEPPVTSFTFEITKLFEEAGYDNTLLVLNKDSGQLDVVFASSDDTAIGQKTSITSGSGSFNCLDFILLPNGWNKESIKNAIKGFLQGLGNLLFENNKLYYETNEGQKTKLCTDIFHSNGISTDGFDHVQTEENDNIYTIKFEDLKGGGDKDYDDLIFDIQLV